MHIGKELGPFKIESELGSGAMGSVYKAFFDKTGEHVAIKIIAPGLLANETAVARFEREGNILKQLRHRNIVRLIASGRYKKTPFLAMEFVDGESLDRVFARRTAFSWEEVSAIGKQLCDALQHAHLKGIIHRDLKPSNVMVLADGTVKLTDFGIAKDTDVTALTNVNSTVGTAAYMSPEQCRGERNLTPKSDLYSLGVMFYELLTGEKPFKADSPLDMFLLHVNAAFERPSRIALTIPVGLDTLVCQMMEKKPEHRPFDAAMVAKVLTEIEEKAAEQRSAGVDAATARRIDRPGSSPDDQDREAARALLAAVSKKKPRKKKRKSSPAVWLKAGGLVAALIAVIAVLFFMARPPSAESLFQLAKAAVESKDEDRVIETTQRFIDVHPKENDVQAQQIRAWRTQFWIAKREKQLFNRFERKLTPDDEGQRFAADALRNENDGDLETAERLWREMDEKYAAAADPEPAVYSWVAHKKRNDLKQVNVQIEQMTESVKLLRLGREPEHKPDSEAERLCLIALRYQLFGDQPAARERWVHVRDQFLKPLDVRPWGVLAADRVRSAVAMPVEMQRTFRLELLKKKLADADRATAASDPTEKREASGICRDVIALYARDPDPSLAAFARPAEQKLRELGGS